jgi:hypothetical protein
MFWCGARKNHEKKIQEMGKRSYTNVGLKHSISGASRFSTMIITSKHGNKTSTLNFSISTLKINMTEVPLLKLNPP